MILCHLIQHQLKVQLIHTHLYMMVKMMIFIIVIMTAMMMTMRCLKGTFFFGKTRSTPFKCFHFVSPSTWLRKLFTRKDFVSFIKSWEMNVDLDVLEYIYQGNSLLRKGSSIISET